jgi:hypothetical protein
MDYFGPGRVFNVFNFLKVFKKDFQKMSSKKGGGKGTKDIMLPFLARSSRGLCFGQRITGILIRFVFFALPV